MSGTSIGVVVVGALALGLCGTAAAEMKDVKGAKEPTLFSRMPNYRIAQYTEREFDGFKFRVTQAGKEVQQNVEGRLSFWKLVFDKSGGAAQPGKLQILRNYQAAAEKLGGTVVFENPNLTTLRVTKDKSEVWAEVASVATGSEYTLRVIEKEAMKQDVVADAEALREGLAAAGHVELQGVFFDTGKATLKPESEAALKEIAKMLQQSAGVKVWVVGHTDYVGAADSNLALSAARAASVAKYLTATLGIDAKRLGSFGAGPYAPVASNAAEEGRARNRRVELVVQP
ncbi:MAG TPA: OmpA family protein [bacterium]